MTEIKKDTINSNETVAALLLALAIENRAKVAAELEGRIDGLTKIHNRKFYDESISREVARINRGRERNPEKNDLCVAMIDIDHFKKFNDTYGHKTGDVVLKKVAQILKEESREADIVARYGGEEFVIIMPNTDIEGGEDAIKRLVKAVEKKTQEAHDRDPDTYKPVKISAGVARFGQDGVSKKGDDITLEDEESLQDAADQALYQAKEGGRNQGRAYKIKIPEAPEVGPEPDEVAVATEQLDEKLEAEAALREQIAKLFPDPEDRMIFYQRGMEKTEDNVAGKTG